MDDPADAMQIVEADQHLARNLLADFKGQTFVVVELYYIQEVAAEDLKDHAEMVAVKRAVDEGIEQADDVVVIAGLALPFLGMGH